MAIATIAKTSNTPSAHARTHAYIFTRTSNNSLQFFALCVLATDSHSRRFQSMVLFQVLLWLFFSLLGNCCLIGIHHLTFTISKLKINLGACRVVYAWHTIIFSFLRIFAHYIIIYAVHDNY